MSYDNGAGKARHFSTKKIINFRFTEQVRTKLNDLALQDGTDKTKYLESLILSQKINKK